MLENFIYENHLKQSFKGLENKVYAYYNDLRDYSWSYDTVNNRISRFYRPLKDRKIPLLVHCSSDEEAMFVKNKLYELTEADVIARRPGKIYIGEYYTNGYITSSVKSDYLIKEKLCKIELTLTSDDTAWYREHTHRFVPKSDNTVEVGSGTDYPYDYAYDYALTTKGNNVMCDSVGDNEFRLLIYGGAVNPTVIINGHAYTVNGEIGPGETLLIDSATKTITLTTAKGYQINWYDKRSRDDYIFKPIPAGQNMVSWSGAFGFDLTIIEKRSEPKWT